MPAKTPRSAPQKPSQPLVPAPADEPSSFPVRLPIPDEPPAIPSDCRTCTRRVPRDTAYGLSWGYCEGCPSLARRCPACATHKAQAGWGYGFVYSSAGLNGRVAWVCADCKLDKSESDLPPRFAVELTLDEIQRHLILSDLRKAPGLPRSVHGDDARGLLRLIKEALEQGPRLDFDVSEYGQETRAAVSVVLSNLSTMVPREAQRPAEALYAAWADLVYRGKAPALTAPVRPRLTQGGESAIFHDERPL